MQSRQRPVSQPDQRRRREALESAGRRLRPDQVREMFRLMGEASEFRAGDAARARHLVSGLRRILGAVAGACVVDTQPSGPGKYVAVALDGWDPSTIRALQALERRGSEHHPCCAALTRACPPERAATVTARRGDVVSNRTWRESIFVQEHLHPTRLDHPLFSRKRLSARGSIQGLGFYRAAADRPFDVADRHLLHIFHRECGALLETPARAIDEPAPETLAPREEQTLHLLLTGLSDKEIAQRMGISRHTVNQYTKAIYRSYGVCSRSALLARTIGSAGTKSRGQAPEGT